MRPSAQAHKGLLAWSGFSSNLLKSLFFPSLSPWINQIHTTTTKSKSTFSYKSQKFVPKTMATTKIPSRSSSTSSPKKASSTSVIFLWPSFADDLCFLAGRPFSPASTNQNLNKKAQTTFLNKFSSWIFACAWNLYYIYELDEGKIESPVPWPMIFDGNLRLFSAMSS